MKERHSLTPQRRPHSGWDLKLAALLFISTCATMSLILPNLPPAGQTGVSAEAAAGDGDDTAARPSAGANPAPAVLIPASPEQRAAAQAELRSGLDQLHKGRYEAAAAAFKEALEKSPGLGAAYIGLGDAYVHLGDYKAAETNARHGLSGLNLLQLGRAPDPALKAQLAYAHQVLGVALLHLARDALDHQQSTISRMQALEAASHCNLATVFERGNQIAQACAKQASALGPAG